MDVLEEVRTKIPRVFVNLVPMFNLSQVSHPSQAGLCVTCHPTRPHTCSQVYEISLRSKHCVEVHRLLPIECICAFTPGEEGDKLR